MGIAALGQLSAHELFATLREARRQLQDVTETGRYTFRSLDPQQNETVTLVTELIIPATDTPGAKEARVNEFIDLMLADWFTDEERTRFIQGLAGLDRDGERFVELEEGEQVAVLMKREQEALESKRELAVQRNGEERAESAADRPFFTVIKWLTLWGYYTSEAGMTEELAHVVFPGSYDGCAPLGEHEV